MRKEWEFEKCIYRPTKKEFFKRPGNLTLAEVALYDKKISKIISNLSILYTSAAFSFPSPCNLNVQNVMEKSLTGCGIC